MQFAKLTRPFSIKPD